MLNWQNYNRWVHLIAYIYYINIENYEESPRNSDFRWYFRSEKNEKLLDEKIVGKIYHIIPGKIARVMAHLRPIGYVNISNFKKSMKIQIFP